MNKRQTGINQGMKMFFGIFMVLVYLGVALLMATNFFNWPNTPTWNLVRWIFAVLLFLYGIYRGYREFKGEHTYGMRTYDDDGDEGEQYMTYADRLKNEEKNNNDEKQI
jgi:hypothetical protein